MLGFNKKKKKSPLELLPSNNYQNKAESGPFWNRMVDLSRIECKKQSLSPSVNTLR